jgi:hypothetical protein
MKSFRNLVFSESSECQFAAAEVLVNDLQSGHCLDDGVDV